MKYLNIKGLLLITTVMLAACNPDSVENVQFEVSTANDITNIYAGDNVTFNFAGNPDYIVFYSGEEGNNYANKDRVSVPVDDLKLRMMTQQTWTKPSFYNKQSVFIHVSENFSGDYSAEGIDAATWTELSTITGEAGKIAVPVPSKTSGTDPAVGGEIDFSGYINKRFYLAVRYHVLPGTSQLNDYQPTVVVRPIEMTKKMGDKTVVMTRPTTDFGFSIVHVKSGTQKTYATNATMLQFQPEGTNFSSEQDVWMISQPMDVSKVDTDKGTPIKMADAKLPSYNHIYRTPGTYTVAFIAKNANKWNASEVVKTITFEVKAKTN